MKIQEQIQLLVKKIQYNLSAEDKLFLFETNVKKGESKYQLLCVVKSRKSRKRGVINKYFQRIRHLIDLEITNGPWELQLMAIRRVNSRHNSKGQNEFVACVDLPDFIARYLLKNHDTESFIPVQVIKHLFL